jgi:hypothetical protein
MKERQGRAYCWPIKREHPKERETRKCILLANKELVWKL